MLAYLICCVGQCNKCANITLEKYAILTLQQYCVCSTHLHMLHIGSQMCYSTPPSCFCYIKN